MVWKTYCLFIGLMLIFAGVFPVTSVLSESYLKSNVDEYPLPPPLSVDMILEETVCRRMSVRYFTGETITDEELSTILWAAYGYTDNENRSIYNPEGTYSTIIYVIRSDATYKYVPENHSLSLFKTGNYLHLGLYTAPIKFGLVWDMNVESDELKAITDIGMIGQNIYFDANALDLGTVTTGMYVDDLYQLGIPSNEKPEIIMPLGHPSSTYDFIYDPLPSSNLPAVVNNTISLEDAIINRQITDRWDDSALSLLEQSQLTWSSYGYSYLYDNVNNKRHRTVPSAIAYYPFKIFAANKTGVYQYTPSTHTLNEILHGDRRQEIKNCVEYNTILLETASYIIIPCLDTNIGGSQYLTYWYYENGAMVHNVILEATALNLSTNVIYGISDESGLRSALGIASQTNLKPLSVVPVGNPQTNPDPNKAPDAPEISGQTNGKTGSSYLYMFSAIDTDDDMIYFYIDWGDNQTEEWIGPYDSGEEVGISHAWQEDGTYQIRAKARDIHGIEGDWGTLEVTMPVIKGAYDLLFLLLLDRFPNLFPVLRYILSL